MFHEWKKIVSRPFRILDVLTAIVPMGLSLFLAFYWKHIPEQVPLHWNAVGEIDSYADAGSYLMLLFMMYFFLAFHQITKLFPLFGIKENLFGKAKAQFVTAQMEGQAYRILYGMLWSMDFLFQLMFAYIILCGIFVQKLGSWFLPILVIFLIADLIWFYVKLNRLKRQA